MTYSFYIRSLHRFSRWDTISFLGFWQFTALWAFEHFPSSHPSRLPLAPDPTFPLAQCWDSTWIKRSSVRALLEYRTTVDCIRDGDIIFQPYSLALVERDEVVRAFQLSQQRVWFRTTRSWELFLGERTVRQFSLDIVIPVDPPPLMTIEAYIPDPPTDVYLEGVDCV